MNSTPSRSKFGELLSASVLIGALGYFVDIYDLVLFSIVRIDSLKDLGIEGQALTDHGVALLNLQMAGMLLGGFFWGILGDKKGRLSVLFGSILTYSLANLANAFVESVQTYALLRFIAGFGLAGELGVAITLVTEVTSKEVRGYATAFIAALGITGAIFAGLSAQFLSWRTAYLIGGVLGLLLLFARIKTADSTIHRRLVVDRHRRGDLFALFTSRDRFKRFLYCTLVGAPCWFVLGLLLAFAPELTRALGVDGVVSVGTAVMFQYAGAALGDLASGALSQVMKSRKKVLALFLGATAVLVGAFLTNRDASAASFYGLFFALGFSTGYWAVFVTTTAEQFGTNLRATVATSVPNLVRGAVIPMTLAMQLMREHIGLVGSIATVGVTMLVLSCVALARLKDSYAFDMDYVEEY